MQLLMYFVLWLGLISIRDCKFPGKHNKNSLERNTANQQFGERMELELLSPNTTLHVQQFERFNISVAVNLNNQTANYSNVEVRVCNRTVVLSNFVWREGEMFDNNDIIPSPVILGE